MNHSLLPRVHNREVKYPTSSTPYYSWISGRTTVPLDKEATHKSERKRLVDLLKQLQSELHFTAFEERGKKDVQYSGQ